MAKFRYQHINSSVENKAPGVEQIKDAEIAVNTYPGKEKLFIKNAAAEPEIVAFISENQVKALINNVSGDVTTIINTISGDVITISGDVTTISGDVITISGDVDTLKATKFGAVKYDSTAKKIYFYANSTGETALAEVDATDFIKDGMVENVEVKDIEVSGETVTVLAVTFNTDAGKEEIDIPLTDIFDPDNYVKVEDYEEDQAVISAALNDLNETKFSKAEWEEEEVIISAALNDLNETKVGKEEFRQTIEEEEAVISAALNDLEVRKADKVHTHVVDDITDLEKDENGNVILRAGTF